MTLIDFYQTKFNSDPYEILYAAYAELAEIAASAGIDWNECAPNIQLVAVQGNAEKYSTYTGKYPAVLEKKLRGRVEIYSRLEISRDGIQYPFINFVKKGFAAGSWNGFQYLLSAHREFNRSNGTPVPTQYDEQENQKRIEKQRKEREERLKREDISRRVTNQNRHQALMEYLHISELFHNASAEDGSHPYAVKKQIGPIFKSCDVRRVLYWDHGPNPKKHEFLAVPLYHLDNRSDGRIIGWQRIYANSEKYQTRAVDDGEFTGACHVIGNLKGAKRVCVVEGFATGASVYLAAKNNFDAVVVAISAGNLINIVDQLATVYEGVKIWCALDNDEHTARVKGKGNTGLRMGIEIMKKFPSVKCTRPIFPTIEEGQSDFNDLYVKFDANEVREQLKSNLNLFHIADNIFDAELALLSVVEIKNIKNQLTSCINAGMGYCPTNLSPRQLVTKIEKKLQEIGLLTEFSKLVRHRVNKRFNWKCRKAQNTRSFSERITDPKLRPKHITYKQFDKPHMTDDVLNYVKSLTGPIIVRAGMGSGKSQHLLRPMMHAAERGIAVAHRVSLIGGLWEMMASGDKDILHYQDQGAQNAATYANKLTICINSIVKNCWQPLMKNHDFFGLDEATQGLRAILSGKAMDNPVGVFNQLIDALARTTEHPVMVDADANDLLVELAELAIKRREEIGLPVWKKIHVIELPVDVRNRETGEPIRVLYTEKDRIMTEVVGAVKRGEKILLATDSATFAEDVATRLEKDHPEKKFLCVNLNTKPNPEVEAFTDSPKKMLIKYDGLIYSPSISSGVSFETPHFDRHFGMFCGEVAPSDAIQMLRRDRTAREFVIGFDRVRQRRETDPVKIKRAYIQAMLENAGKNGEITDVVLDGDRLSLGIANTDFTKMKIEATALENTAKNDYANNMLCIMYSDGYRVEKLAIDLDANELGKELRKEAREIRWDELVQLHINTETPSDDERQELLARRAVSEEERAKLNRWEIEHEMMLPVDESSLKFHREGGKRKIERIELILQDELTVRRWDKEEALLSFHYRYKIGNKWQNFVCSAMTQEQADKIFREKNPSIKPISVKCTPVVDVSLRKFWSIQRDALCRYFAACGIDFEQLLGTGYSGNIDRERLAQARDMLLTPENADVFNNIVKIGGYYQPNQKIKDEADFFRMICKSLGLKIETRRPRVGEKRPTVYTITPESIYFMRDIIGKRRDAGMTLSPRKPETMRVDEVDRDPNVSLYINDDPRSTGETPAAPVSVIEHALGRVPVKIPVDWAQTVLSRDELDTVRQWSPTSIALTFASLYLTEFMERLSGSELRLLRQFINDTRNTGHNELQSAFCG
ncbi:origin of replication binding family protein [Xenorhabdus bovienii]|uniref:plasmid replication protein, CyRepA1 family n=2 Tax=Xenorhabdus bovienii TaxID=40576 RepID=UPI0023B26E16|nr:plasmid replication protein, CyRepA1 family [Xenorhabdus bovienii]MDE9517857.1 origin of replication binding family protein [Xenorhabdus bovienii]